MEGVNSETTDHRSRGGMTSDMVNGGPTLRPNEGGFEQLETKTTIRGRGKGGRWVFSYTITKSCFSGQALERTEDRESSRKKRGARMQEDRTGGLSQIRWKDKNGNVGGKLISPCQTGDKCPRG